MRPRFSILGVMGLVAAAGVGFAALRDPTDWWAGTVFTGTLLGLAFAGLYAVYRKGARRAFWSAFTAFGVGYLVLAFGPWCEAAIRPRLLTPRLLDALFPMLHPAPDITVRLWDATTGLPVNGVAFSPDGRRVVTGGTPAARREHFQDIGHSLAALLLAGLAGLAARRFYARRDERHRETPEKAVGVRLKVPESGL
jgi:MYXO-CTERM domain-containing protein